jgi:hypothetical protein
LSVTVEGQGWSAELANALAAVKAGETQTVPVLTQRTGNGAAAATVLLKAISESDPTQSATASASCAAR